MISANAYLLAAAKLGCEVNAVKAVDQVESTGSGFLPTGDIKILFEPHIFWRELIAIGQNPPAILKQNPAIKDILYAKWGAVPYGKESQQWPRLRRAALIDSPAAHNSASYGRFQILGKYHREAGYKNVFEFVKALAENEDNHLSSFVNLVIARRLHVALQKKDWTTFAKGYNGTGYHQNTSTITDDYDFKLRAAYDSFH